MACMEMMALKAVAEGMKMMARRKMMTPTSASAFTGILRLGWTYAKKLENGRPLSRENCQTSLETDAKALNSERR